MELMYPITAQRSGKPNLCPGGGNTFTRLLLAPLVLEAELLIPDENGTLSSKVAIVELQKGHVTAFLSAAFALSMVTSFSQRLLGRNEEEEKLLL